MAKGNPAHSPAVAVGITTRADDKIFWHELNGIIGNVAQRRPISDAIFFKTIFTFWNSPSLVKW
jgi:hypothetical protein